MMATQRVGLTPRLRDAFEAIQAHIASNNCAPSLDEIKIRLGLASKGRVVKIVHALQERGWITFKPFTTRSIAVVPEDTLAWHAGHVLPSAIEAALKAHCQETGDKPDAVIADLVQLFLEEYETQAAAA